MTKKQLDKIIRLHGLDLNGSPKGVKADLSGADLKGVNLIGINLSGAYLRGANLSGADLSGAYLRCAYLRCANLRYADLSGADLKGAKLKDAYLRYANLWCADLRDANLRGADLRDAGIRDADLGNYSIVPESGQFTGYKRLKHGIIAKLLIHEHAKRIGGLIGRKCRASKVKVLELSNGAAKGYSIYQEDFKYAVGSWIEVANFDDDIRKECTSGIHFFLTRKEAEDYV